MASPDFSNYVDLTVYDLDPFQVYDDAITYARTTLPDFSPRTGTLEDAIIQAIAYNTGLISSQINRLPNGLMEGIARLSGLTRLEATFSSGTVEIEVFDNNGVTIPAGTVFQYETITDDLVSSFPFETTTDLVIAAPDTTGSVAIKGLFAGVYPALLNGQALTLVSPAPSIISIELTTVLSVGTDPETDVQYFDRAAQHFASLSSVLTTKSQLANYIKSTYPNVPYFGVFDLTQNTGGVLWSASSAPGYVTIVAVNTIGGALSTEDATALLTDIQSRCVAGLTVAITSPDFVDIDVACSIAILTGYTSLEVRTAVDEYLTSKLSYSQYDFSGTILKNELISGVANIPGVKYVSDISFTCSDADYSYNATTSVISFASKKNVPNADVTVTVA
jgi:uncharacterized phage protein gp47/JayE